MNEQVKKYYDYLIKQQELCIKWINESLERKQNIKTLNSRYEFISSCIDSFKYYFKDYFKDIDDQFDVSISDTDLPGFDD